MKTTIQLDNLHIASPCHASWDAMTGDDQTRFCKSCQKNVFNLSMMTRAQAEYLIREKEGKLCVRYAQRADGTIITNDCPVGAAAPQMVNNSWHWLRAGVAVAIAALFSALGAQAVESQKCVKTMGKPATTFNQPTPPITGKISVAVPAPQSSQPQPPSVKMGEMVAPNVVKPPAIIMGGATPPPRQLMGEPASKPATVKPTVKVIRCDTKAASGPKVIRVAPQKTAKPAKTTRKP